MRVVSLPLCGVAKPLDRLDGACNLLKECLWRFFCYGQKQCSDVAGDVGSSSYHRRGSPGGANVGFATWTSTDDPCISEPLGSFGCVGQRGSEDSGGGGSASGPG